MKGQTELYEEAKKQFRDGEYQEAKKNFELLTDPTFADKAYLALGIMYAEGLGVNADLKQAAMLFDQIAGSSVEVDVKYKAKIYLSRIYEKLSDPEKAKNYDIAEQNVNMDELALVTYGEIIEELSTEPNLEPELRENLAYAQYRAARLYKAIAQKDITEPEERDINIKLAAASFEEAIKNYEELGDQVPKIALAKLYYHAGLFYQEQGNDTRAKELLFKSTNLGYSKAEEAVASYLKKDMEELQHSLGEFVASMTDTQVKTEGGTYQDPVQDKEYNSVLKACDVLLDYNPQNAQVMLYKAEIMLNRVSNKSFNHTLNPIDFAPALALLREVVKIDPQNKRAVSLLSERRRDYEARLKSDMISEINDLFKMPSGFVQLTYYVLGEDYTANRNMVVNYVVGEICNKLAEIPYIKDKYSYEDQQELVKLVYLKIQQNPKHMEQIKQAIEGQSGTQLAQQLKKNLDTVIVDVENICKEWGKGKEQRIPKAELVVSKRDLNKKQLFADKFEQIYMQLYQDSISITRTDNPLDPAVDKATIEQALNVGAFAASPFSPILGALGPTLAVTANEASHQIHDYRKELVRQGAAFIAQLGNRDPEQMRNIIKLIGAEIADKYGSQIEDIKPDDLEKLARAAVERITANIISKNSFIERAKGHIADFATWILGAKKGEKLEILDHETLVRESFAKGKSSREIHISTDILGSTSRYGKDWTADGLFDHSGVTTSDGLMFHTEPGRDPEKYGFAKVSASELFGFVECPLSEDEQVFHRQKLANASSVPVQTLPKKTEIRANPNGTLTLDPRELEEEVKKLNAAQQKLQKTGTLTGVAYGVGAAAIGTAAVVASAPAVLVAGAVAYGAKKVIGALAKTKDQQETKIDQYQANIRAALTKTNKSPATTVAVVRKEKAKPDLFRAKKDLGRS